MKKNIGKVDKTVRILAGAVIAVLYFANLLSGTWAIVLGILAVIFIVTAYINFCPLYLPFRINTCKRKNG